MYHAGRFTFCLEEEFLQIICPWHQKGYSLEIGDPAEALLKLLVVDISRQETVIKQSISI